MIEHWIQSYKTRRKYTLEGRIVAAWIAVRHVLFSGDLHCHAKRLLSDRDRGAA